MDKATRQRHQEGAAFRNYMRIFRYLGIEEETQLQLTAPAFKDQINAVTFYEWKKMIMGSDKD